MAAIQAIPLMLRRSALFARKAELDGRLTTIEAALDTPPSPDWDDMAIVRKDDDVLEATGLSGQQELRQINAAIARLDAGTYGVCAKCGAEIGEARLNALPYTPHCRTCAA